MNSCSLILRMRYIFTLFFIVLTLGIGSNAIGEYADDEKPCDQDNKCSAGGYCVALFCPECEPGYTSDEGATSASQCYLMCTGTIPTGNGMFKVGAIDKDKNYEAGVTKTCTPAVRRCSLPTAGLRQTDGSSAFVRASVNKQNFHNIDLMYLAGTPPTIVFASTSFVTTAPAATTALSPIFTPAKMVELEPIHTFLPTTMPLGTHI